MDSISRLAEAFRAGEVASEQLTRDALQRIQQHQQSGGLAYVSVDAERARRTARELDRLRSTGFVPSQLAGIPISITDAFDVAGEVTRAASRIRAEEVAAVRDAPAIARLHNAGAVLLGRTNMSEFAFSMLGTNPHYGTPTLPGDDERVVGGADSGLAVSVVLRMAVAGVGSDTQGSIRVPAAFSGLVGFKPTASRISTQGVFPLSPSLDSVGCLANCVEDCAILDAILSAERRELANVSLVGLRFGVTADYVLNDLSHPVDLAFKRALYVLEEAGATLRWIEFPELDELPRINSSGGFVAAEAWYTHRRLLEGGGAAYYDPTVVQRLREGADLSAFDYMELLSERRRLISAAEYRLGGVDAWLMPTVPMVAPRLHELASSGAGDPYSKLEAQVRRNTSIVNFVDGCALTLPCQSPGEPAVGISVVGMHGTDKRVLGIGRAVEKVFQRSQLGLRSP